MEVRKADNTAFKANVFVSEAKAVDKAHARELAIKSGFIRETDVRARIEESDYGYLVLDVKTTVVKMLDRIFNLRGKIFDTCGSKLRGPAQDEYLGALHNIAFDRNTKKIL